MTSQGAHRVLITGGSGFIGTNLIQHYLHMGAEVVNLDLKLPRNPSHGHLWRQVDITDRGALGAVVAEFAPNTILHMAARTDLHGRSLADYEANIGGVRNIIEAAATGSTLKRVVFASSMLVCALGYKPRGPLDFCPDTAYGASKAIGERLIRAHGNGRIPWTIVRPTSLWGPWFASPYRDFFRAVSRGLYFHPRGKRVLRSYGFVLNAVHEIAAIVSRQPSEDVEGKVFYLADYEPTDVFQWARYISSELGIRPPRQIPTLVLICAAYAGNVLKYAGYSDVPLTSFRLRNLLTEAVYDTTELHDMTGPLPYSLREGTRITIEWMRNRAPQGLSA